MVQRLTPPPAIPEEARRFSVRGQIAIKEAKSASDFDEAAKEFGRVLQAAPWWADGYINQGVALDKAGKFSEAARALKFYLLAAPNAPDAQSVRDQIYALEYRQEKAQKEIAAKQQKGEQERLARQRAEDERRARQTQIAGDWYDGDPPQEGTRRFQVSISGNSIEIMATHIYWRLPRGDSPLSWTPWRAPPLVWRETIEGLTITGTFYGDNSIWNGGSKYTRPMSGSISPDGKTLRLQYKSVITSGRPPVPLGGWRESDQELVLRR